MKVTIFRGDEWHKAIEEYHAEQIMHCRKWQLEKAMKAKKPLRGWKISKGEKDDA
ncbi:hypothetical protein IWT140_01743 [Secundilactobacillus pentosiphilus]|uniref:Uncharacterized protein n=1 Tax=Secundilactobacillus pentosiphilus TaxID=1714682 RepID=A0A1Z5IR05_9LACO|nr:hypothetical protein [Secundilactobacillus pentosiphilus]GAX04106.1 hypothetical protein IWT140_01743 [Secundilactobacillus pentosiphilus]